MDKLRHIRVDKNSQLGRFISNYTISPPEIVKVTDVFEIEDKVTPTPSGLRHAKNIDGLTITRKDLRVKMEHKSGETSQKRLNNFDKKIFEDYGFKSPSDLITSGVVFAIIYTLNKPRSNSEVYSYYGLYPMDMVENFDFAYTGEDLYKYIVFIQEGIIAPISNLVGEEAE